MANLTIIAEFALSYGFIPIPLKGKKPIFPAWQRTTEQTALRKVEEAVEKNMANNIGVLTGLPSGIIVVDIDVAKGGLEYWTSLLEEHSIPETFVVETGTGGRHYYFRYENRLAFLRNATKAIKDHGIDLKTNGGQVVFAFSLNHETGKKYKIIEGFNFKTEELSLTRMPDWLLELLQANQEQLDKKYKRFYL